MDPQNITPEEARTMLYASGWRWNLDQPTRRERLGKPVMQDFEFHHEASGRTVVASAFDHLDACREVFLRIRES